MTLWIIHLTSTHPKLSKNDMFTVLFLVVYLLRYFFFTLKGKKTVRLQEPSAPFCGILNELMSSDAKEHIRHNL